LRQIDPPIRIPRIVRLAVEAEVVPDKANETDRRARDKLRARLSSFSRCASAAFRVTQPTSASGFRARIVSRRIPLSA
jgi:hypothetical protein